MLFVLSPVSFLYLMYQKGYQMWVILRLSEHAGLWGRYRLKQGNPLQFFKKTIKLCLLCLFLYSLTNCIKYGIKDNLFGYQIKTVGLWHRYGLNQRNRLQKFENNNKIIFVLFTNFYTHFSIKYINRKKVWRWIENKFSYEAYFLHEYIYTCAMVISNWNYPMVLLDKGYIWMDNYI